MTTAERGSIQVTNRGGGVRLVLVNGVEYSMALERGHSAQAPFGMVRLSLREVEHELTGRETLPEAIRKVYAQTFNKGGHPGRARQILDAVGDQRGTVGGV
jgi:hypothetical protein